MLIKVFLDPYKPIQGRKNNLKNRCGGNGEMAYFECNPTFYS